MLSVSLPFRALAAGEELGAEPFLQQLAETGVKSAEIRTVYANADPNTVLTAAGSVWRHGMRISVHTAPRSAQTAVQDVFAPLRDVLRAEKQREILLVLHPVNGEDLLSENQRMLCALTDAIRQNAFPVKLALENNRLMPNRTPGDSAGLVLRVIRGADPEYAGLCFDFGHFAWVTRAWETAAPILPPEEFTRRVIHTHIHALAGPEKNHTTHFPLQVGFLPLKAYLQALGASYAGAYNLELEPERFSPCQSGKEGILGSLDLLKKALR